MTRLKAFIMWVIYFVCPTDLYLKLNGYNPKEVGAKAAATAKKHLETHDPEGR